MMQVCARGHGLKVFLLLPCPVWVRVTRCDSVTISDIISGGTLLCRPNCYVARALASLRDVSEGLLEENLEWRGVGALGPPLTRAQKAVRTQLRDITHCVGQ